jgi:hypothetical protein
MISTRFVFFTGMILAAALSRLLPHPPNVAPMNAMALFAGAYLADGRVRKYIAAFAVPLTAMLLSDIALERSTGWGFYSGMWVVYGAIMLVTALGFRLSSLQQQRSPLMIGGFAFAGSILFFGLTNFAVWALGTMYPHTGAGLAACFMAALPFFQNSLLGDALYTTVLFGGVALAERTISGLRLQSSPSSSLALEIHKEKV